MRTPAQCLSEASVKRHNIFESSGCARVAASCSACLTEWKQDRWSLFQEVWCRAIFWAHLRVRLPALSYTSSNSDARGSISLLNCGMEDRIQFAAQTNCCNSAPFAGSVIASRANRRRGSRRTPCLLISLPHQLNSRRKRRHFLECSFNPYCLQSAKKLP